MKDNKKPIPDKSRRAPKRDIDGIFLLDKPSGISSALALTKVRGIYRGRSHWIFRSISFRTFTNLFRAGS